jgi:membrane protease YdiL (CAAX protease family)
MWRRLWSDPIFPYVFPFALFSLFLAAESLHPLAVYAVYPVKTFAVGLALFLLLRRLPSLVPNRPWLSIGIGALVFVEWVGLDAQAYSFSLFCAEQINNLGQTIGSGPLFRDLHTPRSGFNPYVFGHAEMAWGLIFFRILGAAAVVPVMEEIFWRGFLMRYLVREDFEKIPLGTYTFFSFAVTTLAFAAVHGAQWPLALMCGLLYGGWFLFTKNLGNVIIAHAVTNLLLGLYVVKTGRWYFW